YSVNFPEEIYEYHKALGLNYMQFIPCVETDPKDRTKAAPFSVTAEQYGTFLTKVFDLWYADIKDGVAATSVRYFDSVFHRYVGLEAPDCTLMESCGAYLVVEHTGDVYACDFYVENEWKLGNLRTNKLEWMLNSSCQKAFGEMKAALPKECVPCEWLKKCHGGCTKDRVRDPRDNGSNHFCESYKIFFAHADKKLTVLADQWMVNQGR
ncbi:MAG: SPASM domain-containing protein, partial [Bacteroidota bacterium]